MREFVIQLSNETMQEIRNGMEVEDWANGPATTDADLINQLFLFDNYRQVVDVRHKVKVEEVK